MRRKPDDVEEGYAVPESAFVGARRGEASRIVHGVQPMFASGGMSYWFSDAGGAGYFPQAAGTQLVTSLYVPKGRQGFLKEIRIAPYCPAPLCDPWTTSGMTGASWRAWNRETDGPEGEQFAMGALWETPMGWEAAFDNISSILPKWRWILRFFQGNVTILRGQGFLNIPPFDVGDPESWYLVPSIPVPSAAYAAGLPGSSVGPSWDEQRMQILPRDKISFHVPVPQDTTVLLFAQWTQDYVMAAGQMQPPTPGNPEVQVWGKTFPIGPSIGSLLGYTQASGSSGARDNLENGWGG
jgi:hypothetical protein